MFFTPITMKVHVQHLATTKTIYVDKSESLCDIKQKAADAFCINTENITLKNGEQTLNVDHKTVEELDLKENSTLTLKITHKIEGKKKGIDIMSTLKTPGMKSMLKNPQTIKMVSKMFKKENSESEENETMRMLLNNEGFEEEIDKMTEGGDYMDMQLRNVDLAMAKLENMPGGMNMMSSMLKDVNNPMKALNPKKSFNEGYAMKEGQSEKLSFAQNKNINYELLYRNQLNIMKENGLVNKEDNIAALVEKEGDSNQAIIYLLEKYNN